MKIMFEMAAYSLVTLGLGLLVGRTGMYSLCQIPMVAAGAWFALRVHFLLDGAPFPVILLAHRRADRPARRRHRTSRPCV